MILFVFAHETNTALNSTSVITLIIIDRQRTAAAVAWCIAWGFSTNECMHQTWIDRSASSEHTISQRFVSSIGNIEKAMWVFNSLGRSGWFGQSEIILHTDINFTMKDPWQFSNWYAKNYPNQKKFGSLVFEPKKECWF
jgi:hypothetical protein